MRQRATAWLPQSYCFLLAAVICAPSFAPGYLLHRDLVSTPRSYLTDAALGATEAAPRAVPQDALIAVLSALIDGGIIVKIAIFGALLLAGLGADALVRTVLTGMHPGARIVAITVAVWNPYVAERLMQGHWSLLAGYAGLFWAVHFAYSIRLDFRDRTAWSGLTVALAASALTPTGGIIALVGTLIALSDRGRSFTLAGLLGLVANLPWIVASIGGTVRSDPDAVGAFAARAEPWLGTIGSLAGLGGIWNSEAVPSFRTTPFALVGTLVLLAIVGLGARQAVRAGAVAQRLAILAAAAVVIPALLATGLGLAVLEVVVETVPGAGLVRDTQKFVCLAAPFYVLAAAAGCRVAYRFQVPSPVKAGALVLVLLPLAWGAESALRPVPIAPSWEKVAQILEGSSPGDVAVLPAGQFRLFDDATTPVLDPAPRMLPRDVLQTGDLVVSQTQIAGESSRAVDVEKLLLEGTAPGRLAARGVGFVLVEKNTRGPLGKSSETLNRMRLAYEDETLALYAVEEPVAETHANRWPAVVSHAVWAAMIAVGSGGLALTWFVRRRDRADQPGNRLTRD